MRWHHPERGLLLPSDFIGTAESTGLIVEIGMNVAEQALAFARTWPRSAATAANRALDELRAGRARNERLIPDLAVALAKAGLDATG